MKIRSSQLLDNKLTCSELCDLVAHWLEHCTGIVEVIGSNPVESPEFFRFMRQLLKIVQQVRISYLHLISNKNYQSPPKISSSLLLGPHAFNSKLINHRPNNPGRPIVSTCSCPSELFSSYLGSCSTTN